MNLELLPDQPARDNPGVLQARNVYPYAGAFRPVRGLQSVTNALDSKCLGAASLIKGDGTIYNYAGDATKVYTRTGSTYTAVSTSHTAIHWEFERLFDTVFAVNGSQKVLSGTFGGALSEATGSPAGVKTLCVSRNFVVVANSTADVAKVYWSALGAGGNWTTAESGSQHLPGAGKIVNVVGGEFVLVLCERGIYRMSYIGATPYWQFDLIESQRGALANGMVANVGYRTYYLDSAGFFVCDGTHSEPISSGKLTRTFLDDFDPSASAACSALADTTNNLIIFSYPGAGHTGIANHQMIYNYVEDRWSGPVEQTVETLVYSVTLATTSDSISSACDGISLSCDAPGYGGKYSALAVFDNSHKLALQSGSTLDALVESGEAAFDPTNKSFVLGMRPVVDGAATGIQGAVDFRNSTGGTITRGALKSINPRTGMIYERCYARFHRFRLQVTGDFDAIIGFEPILQEGPR